VVRDSVDAAGRPGGVTQVFKAHQLWNGKCDDRVAELSAILSKGPAPAGPADACR